MVREKNMFNIVTIAKECGSGGWYKSCLIEKRFYGRSLIYEKAEGISADTTSLQGGRSRQLLSRQTQDSGEGAV